VHDHTTVINKTVGIEMYNVKHFNKNANTHFCHADFFSKDKFYTTETNATN
jgi:hypothetical protein